MVKDPVVILANGNYPTHPIPVKKLHKAGCIICCDGAAGQLTDKGLEPSIIIGDLMLDQYIFGEVNRISPEAPVLVLSYKDNYHVLGGALNVAQNLHNLGTNILPIGIIGNDNSGKKC